MVQGRSLNIAMVAQARNLFNMKDITTVIENHYDYGVIKHVEKAGGLSQENYFYYTDSEGYFVKLYQSSERDIAEKICVITEFFYTNNIPTILPLYNKYSSQVTETADNIILLYPKLDGRILHQGEFNNSILQAVAKLLASIHSLTQNARNTDLQLFSINWNVDIEDYEDKLNELRAHGDIDYLSKYERFLVKNYTSIKHELLQKLSVIAYDNDISKYRIIHGDFHNENLLFDSEDNIIAVIDFANTSFGNPMIDIFSFINHACCNEGFTIDNITKAKYFINEYQKYSIDVSDQDIINGLYFAIAKWCSSLFFERKLYDERDINFISYIKRDTRKLKFLIYFIALSDEL